MSAQDLANLKRHRLWTFIVKKVRTIDEIPMEIDLQSLFGLLCTAVLIGWDPATPPPPIWAHIWGRYWFSQDRRHLLANYGDRSPKFIWAPVYSCTHWQRPRNPPLPLPHLGSYMRTLRYWFRQDRRHLFVTPLVWTIHACDMANLKRLRLWTFIVKKVWTIHSYCY